MEYEELDLSAKKTSTALKADNRRLKEDVKRLKTNLLNEHNRVMELNTTLEQERQQRRHKSRERSKPRSPSPREPPANSSSIEKVGMLVGCDLKMIGIESKTCFLVESDISSDLRMLWVRVPSQVKRIITEGTEFLAEKLRQEIDFRLKTEEQSAEIIQKLHSTNENLVSGLTELRKNGSSN